MLLQHTHVTRGIFFRGPRSKAFEQKATNAGFPFRPSDSLQAQAAKLANCEF
jgi:hypothetical protein